MRPITILRMKPPGGGGGGGSPVVALSDQASFAPSPSYSINANGNAVLDGSNIPGEWLVAGLASDCEVKWTLISFTQASGSGGYSAPNGLWNPSTVTRTVSVSSAGGSSGVLTGTFQIRRTSDNTVLASMTITLDNQ